MKKPEVSWTLSWRIVFGVGFDFSAPTHNLKDKLKIITLWVGPLCVCFIWDPTKSTFMKLILWKASLFVLLIMLLGVALNIIRVTSTMDRATFGAIVIASAAFLIAVTSILKPFTHK